jgi:membrane protein
VRGWWQMTKRVWSRWNQEQMPIIAAGLAFRALLTLFPILLAAVAVTGLVAEPEALSAALSGLLEPLPDDAQNLVIENAERITRTSTVGLGTGLVVALLVALWSTSNGIMALKGVYNQIYLELDTRPFYIQRLVAIVLGLVLLLAAALATVLVVALPPLLDLLPIEGLARYLAGLLRYALLAGLLLVVQAVLGRFAVHRRSPRWRWLQVGSVVGLVLWLLACTLFAWYLDELSRLDRVYGTLASLIVLALWLQISVSALLMGALINAESEHQTDRDSTVGEDRPPGQRGAYVADHSVHDSEDEPPAEKT